MAGSVACFTLLSLPRAFGAAANKGSSGTARSARASHSACRRSRPIERKAVGLGQLDDGMRRDAAAAVQLLDALCKGAPATTRAASIATQTVDLAKAEAKRGVAPPAPGTRRRFQAAVPAALVDVDRQHRDAVHLRILHDLRGA